MDLSHQSVVENLPYMYIQTQCTASFVQSDLFVMIQIQSNVIFDMNLNGPQKGPSLHNGTLWDKI